jgi:hypothetical protein
VPDQETEETQPYAPKAGASSQMWEQRGSKKYGRTSGFKLLLIRLKKPATSDIVS